MVLGTMKMPLPMTVPTTMAAALQIPRSRLRSNRLVPASGGFGVMRRFSEEQRNDGAGHEGGRGPDQNVPGERDMRPFFHTNHEDETGDHCDHSRILLPAFLTQTPKAHPTHPS